MNKPAKEPVVFIIDDEPRIVKALIRLIRDEACKVYSANDGNSALELAGEISPALTICDQRMPGMKGTDLLKQLKEIHPDSYRVILSGYADFNDIIEGFNSHCVDKFLHKPWDNEEILALVREKIGQQSQLSVLDNSFHGMWSSEPVMFSLFQHITKIARANVPVFIHGETGAGKELTAKAIHLESERADKPFIAINCANFSNELMESQLFGHKKGAFTGAVADQKGLLAEVKGGTLFLDEITSLPLNLQSKLLRVLQERVYTPVGTHTEVSFDGELVSASNLDLKKAVAAGEFREDLRYRLEVIPLELPPLRERPKDIPLLLTRFLKKYNHKMPWTLGDECAAFLLAYSWPGNVRQLLNVAQYLAATCEKAEITISDLPSTLYSAASTTTSQTPTVHKIDKESIRQALLLNENNKSLTANYLGISRMTLWRHMKKFDLA